MASSATFDRGRPRDEHHEDGREHGRRADRAELNRTLDLGYAKGTALLVTALLVILGAWRLATGSLAVDRVTTRGL